MGIYADMILYSDEKSRETLTKCVLVHGNNVLDYCHKYKGLFTEEKTKEGLTDINGLSLGDVPNAAPSFPNMFFEFNTEQFGNIVGFPKAIGVFATSFDFQNRDDEKMKTISIFGMQGAFGISCETMIQKSIFKDVRWIINATVFASPLSEQSEKALCCREACKFIIGVNSDGSIPKYTEIDGEERFFCIPVYNTYDDENLGEYYIAKRRWICQSMATAALMCLSFMHCKNVIPESIDIDESNKRVRRQNKYREKHGLPKLKQYTLNIDPMKKVMNSEGDIEHYGLKKALHICRGHFRNYMEGSIKFGNLQGMYWVPDYKNYNIKMD